MDQNKLDTLTTLHFSRNHSFPSFFPFVIRSWCTFRKCHFIETIEIRWPLNHGNQMKFLHKIKQKFVTGLYGSQFRTVYIFLPVNRNTNEYWHSFKVPCTNWFYFSIFVSTPFWLFTLAKKARIHISIESHCHSNDSRLKWQ